jgi:hypothetical protein
MTGRERGRRQLRDIGGQDESYQDDHQQHPNSLPQVRRNGPVLALQRHLVRGLQERQSLRAVEATAIPGWRSIAGRRKPSWPSVKGPMSGPPTNMSGNPRRRGKAGHHDCRTGRRTPIWPRRRATGLPRALSATPNNAQNGLRLTACSARSKGVPRHLKFLENGNFCI